MNWKKGIIYFLTGLSLLIIFACARTITFSHEMRTRINLLNDDLKKVQFYVSEKIIIQREFVNWKTEINTEHDLRQIGNHYLETVVINTNTPGIVVEATDDELHVSFEPDPNFYLVFCRNCSEKKTDSDLYSLLSWKVKGKDVERIENTVLFDNVSDNAKLYFTDYGNQDFYIANNSHGAYLKLKDKVVENFKRTKRVLPGITIPND
ncbi:MAG: hypothetical protein K9N06_06255 [Candidatus Cloacimonetes bacterium]|nr:hypothetical protein [Candidatus Cloacimonadota bacterium]